MERFARQLAVFAGSGGGLSGEVGVRGCEMADADELEVCDATLGRELAGAGHNDVDDDQDLDEDDDPDDDPEAVHELHDRLIEIRHALDLLGAITPELAATRGRQEAQRILTDLLEEIHQLPDALAAAIASQPAD